MIECEIILERRMVFCLRSLTGKVQDMVLNIGQIYIILLQCKTSFDIITEVLIARGYLHK